MKKVVLVFCVAGFLMACKKDHNSNNSSETVLSKVYYNNKLAAEFIYSPQKQVSTLIEYSETGKPYPTVFTYNADGKVATESYYSNSKLSGKVVYTYEAGGNISQGQYMSLSGTDSGKYINKIKYSYDGAGRINQQAGLNLITGVVESTRDLAYYDNNNLRSESVTDYSGVPKLQWKTEYTTGNPLPSSLYKHRGYPINFLLYDMVTGEKHYLQYSNGTTVVGESKETYTNRKYDNDGYLLEQTSTVTKILPVGPSLATQIKYEYIKL